MSRGGLEHEVRLRRVQPTVTIFLVILGVRYLIKWFLGLPETAVDSEDEDEESCPSHDSYQELKDNVRECLEKEPSERTNDDISILMVGLLFLSKSDPLISGREGEGEHLLGLHFPKSELLEWNWRGVGQKTNYL